MLSVQNLSCRRGGRIIFQNLAFDCKPGDFVLVTGANGCGKSSLLRTLAQLLPSDGTISWNRTLLCDVFQSQAVLRYIGHQDALKPTLTGHEMLTYWKALRGADPQTVRPPTDAFDVRPFLDLPVRRLSAGQKRRLSLTRLVLDICPLWILDEPTTALDAYGERLLFEEVEQHRLRGGSVIAAMHHDPDTEITKRISLSRAQS